MITRSRLMDVLEYDQVTGVFTVKIATARRVKVGDVAGYVDRTTGYRRITIDSKKYFAHRLAFLYMSGRMPRMVDHIDRDKTNNSWENLREANPTVNNRNLSMNSRNKSGVNGVYWSDTRKKWIAFVHIHNCPKSLGGFKTLEEAKAAREGANKKYGFSFGHGRAA